MPDRWRARGTCSPRGDLRQRADEVADTGEPFRRNLPGAPVDKALVRAQLAGDGLLADEADQTLRVGEGVVAEADDGALRAGLDPLDVGGAAKLFYRNYFQQVVHLVRHHAEAVDQLGGKGVDGLAVGEVAEPAVK